MSSVVDFSIAYVLRREMNTTRVFDGKVVCAIDKSKRWSDDHHNLLQWNMKLIESANPRPAQYARVQGRLQLASAFTLWARLSSAAAYADQKANTAAAARQRRILRACLTALSRNASAQLHGRRALYSLERILRLRRLARGWGAITAAAAAAAATSRARVRLGTAEARVFAGREAVRVHAHRMARRLLGLARGRTALEAFMAWKAFARQAHGARLGAHALAARWIWLYFLW